MGDEDQRGAVPPLHLGDQPQDVQLNRDIERGRRLVGDDEARTAGECHGDEHALAHAAGQLMRIAVEHLLGLAQMGGGEHGRRAAPALAAGGAADAPQLLVELLSDGLQRVERGLRRLWDEGDLPPEQGPARRGLHAHQVAALEQAGARRDGEARRQQIGDGATDHGLAGAGFAHQAENLRALQIERKPADHRNALSGDGGVDG